MTEISVFRPGDVSYLRIAAPDPARSAGFYSAVFGWRIRNDSTAFAFFERGDFLAVMHQRRDDAFGALGLIA